MAARVIYERPRLQQEDNVVKPYKIQQKVFGPESWVIRREDGAWLGGVWKDNEGDWHSSTVKNYKSREAAAEALWGAAINADGTPIEE